MNSDSHLNKKVLVAKILEFVVRFPGARIQLKYNNDERFSSINTKANMNESYIDDVDNLGQFIRIMSEGSSAFVGIAV